MKNFRHHRGAHALLMFAGLAVIVTAIMFLWNYLIPSIIGWSAINYWQALGLFVLARLLFGGFGGHGFVRRPDRDHSHMHHFFGQMKNMSSEERKDYIRQRFEERQQAFNDHMFGKEQPKE